MNQTEHQGACLCGQVKLKVTGSPIAAGYCHCDTCRRWHAAPVNSWSIWAKDAVTFLEGEDTLKEFRLSEKSHRHWCENCGTGVVNRIQGDMIIVYPMMLAESDFELNPIMHVQYAERVMDVNDGLPKFKDFPADFGGTGEMID